MGYANGGVVPCSGGSPDVYRFAEPERDWETFITQSAASRDRNLRTWEEAGRAIHQRPDDEEDS